MVELDTVETYRPSGKCTRKGIAVMVGLGLCGAIAACLVLHLLGRVVYIGVVFALLLGLVTGGAVLFGVRLGKCRQPIAAGLVGLILGLGGYLALHYLNYASKLRNFERTVESQLGDKSSDTKLVNALVRKCMSEQWGGVGFGAYLKGWRQGLSRVFWLVEVLLVAGLAAVVPFLAAHDAFCDGCDQWCDHMEIVVGPLSARDAILEACHPENLKDLAKIERVSANVSRCVVDLDFCPVCKETGFVTVRTFEEGGAASTKETEVLSEVVVSGKQVALLVSEGTSAGPHHAEDEARELDSLRPGDSEGEDGKILTPEARHAKDMGKDIATEGAAQESNKDGLNNGKV